MSALGPRARRGVAPSTAPRLGSGSARGSPGSASSPAGSARGGSPPSPIAPKRNTVNSATSPPRTSSSAGSLGRGSSFADGADGVGSAPISRASSSGDCRRDPAGGGSASGAREGRPKSTDSHGGVPQESVGLFHIIQQLAAAENALWNILDGLKSNTTHASFFCREYWGSSGSQAQLSLEKLNCQERLKRQVQQACVLESLSLGVASHLCSGVMQNISVTIRSRLRNLLYYIHENCLVLLDMVCQRWLLENQNHWQESSKTGHCPENLNLDILVRVKRYRRLRRGEHVMALRQHNEMIVNVVRQLCRGAAPKRPPLSSRGSGSGASSPSGPVGGSRSPGPSRDTSGGGGSISGQQPSALAVVNDILTARMPLDRLRASTIRSKMLQYMCFKPLLNIEGLDPECPWPTEDPYVRYGAEHFAHDGQTIWFEPLPPMLPDLERNPKLPPATPETYTLVLDLDETLVHYFELDGMGNYDIRPGMHEFLERMSQLGYELVIFTAATQDYADWVIDQIDPGRLIHHRLYRQHALPWGPIFVKDLSRLGRDLDHTLIIDNVQENFMLQPHHGIFICTWYDDPSDTALFALTPLLDELIATRARVPEILDKYRDQIPTWAGFDQFSQLGAEYSSEFDLPQDDQGLMQHEQHLQQSHQGPTSEPPMVSHTPTAPAHTAHAAAPPLLPQQQQQQQQQQHALPQPPPPQQQQPPPQQQPPQHQQQQQQQQQQQHQQQQQQQQQQHHSLGHHTPTVYHHQPQLSNDFHAAERDAQQDDYIASLSGSVSGTATTPQPSYAPPEQVVGRAQGLGSSVAGTPYTGRYQQPSQAQAPQTHGATQPFMNPPQLHAPLPGAGYPQSQQQQQQHQQQQQQQQHQQHHGAGTSLHAQQPPSRGEVQQKAPQRSQGPPMTVQQAGLVQQPAGQPRPQQAPAFSASGISGPYQAAPPPQPQAGVGSAGHASAPAMWGRPGFGPCQVARRR